MEGGYGESGMLGGKADLIRTGQKCALSASPLMHSFPSEEEGVGWLEGGWVLFTGTPQPRHPPLSFLQFFLRTPLYWSPPKQTNPQPTFHYFQYASLFLLYLLLTSVQIGAWKRNFQPLLLRKLRRTGRHGKTVAPSRLQLLTVKKLKLRVPAFLSPPPSPPPLPLIWMYLRQCR